MTVMIFRDIADILASQNVLLDSVTYRAICFIPVNYSAFHFIGHNTAFVRTPLSRYSTDIVFQLCRRHVTKIKLDSRRWLAHAFQLLSHSPRQLRYSSTKCRSIIFIEGYIILLPDIRCTLGAFAPQRRSVTKAWYCVCFHFWLWYLIDFWWWCAFSPWYYCRHLHTTLIYFSACLSTASHYATRRILHAFIRRRIAFSASSLAKGHYRHEQCHLPQKCILRQTTPRYRILFIIDIIDEFDNSSIRYYIWGLVVFVWAHWGFLPGASAIIAFGVSRWLPHSAKERAYNRAVDCFDIATFDIFSLSLTESRSRVGLLSYWVSASEFASRISRKKNIFISLPFSREEVFSPAPQPLHSLIMRLCSTPINIFDI